MTVAAPQRMARVSPWVLRPGNPQRWPRGLAMTRSPKTTRLESPHQVPDRSLLCHAHGQRLRSRGLGRHI